jgi:hypothetical protein
MYLGTDDETPGCRLDALEHLIAGYYWAVRAHRILDPGVDRWIEFPSHLAARFGWSMSQGPIRAIRQASESDAEAWTRFWSLLHEFAQFDPFAG